MNTLLRDFRGQLSWGRFCAAVALVMAVKVQLSGGSVAHVSLWLGTAVGNYGLSKGTEMLTAKFASVSSMGCVGTSLRAGGDHD